MAATEAKPRSNALRTLTAAALALPGLMQGTAQAADGDEATFEYHHYEEGQRDLDGQTYRDLKLKPLQADSLATGIRGSIVDRWKFGLDYSQDTWSGATPVTTAPHAAIAAQIFSGASIPSYYSADPKHRPIVINYDRRFLSYVRDPKLVDIMGSASPETRRQVSSKVGYEWDTLAINTGGGISDEPDYKSWFVNTDGKLDVNQKLTTLSWGASYTTSNIAASLEANNAADWGNYTDQIRLKDGENTLYGTRHDTAADIGVTQIIDRDTLLSASLGYTHSSGYLSDPYKATLLAFDDPNQFLDSSRLRFVQLKGVLEQRPTIRDQWTFDAHYLQYLPGTNTAVHLDYRFFHDDWGIDAHTLNLSVYQPLGGGWMVVPGLRYYTQSAADFYQPYFLFNQAFPYKLPRNPEVPPQIDFSKLPIQHFSSDERLSGFGSLTAQFALDKQLRDDLKLEIGAEYMVREGALKLGGGGESGYADLNSYTIYATLRLDLAGHDGLAGYRDDSDDDAAAPADPAILSWDRKVPAGVRFTHVLPQAGDYAIDLHHDYAIQDGGLRHGSEHVQNAVVTKLDCGGQPCTRVDSGDYSHLTTLDLLYAPVDRITLMVSPSFVDLHQNQTDLGDNSSGGGCCHPIGGSILPPLGGGAKPPSLRHSSAGLGDTGVYVLGSLAQGSDYRIDAALGLSLPTGSVDRRLNTSNDYLNYGLQIGSGTVDFTPSLTYLGHMGRFSWGAQFSAVKRLQARNDSGYALGDKVQGSVWASADILNWLSASVRGIGTGQAAIDGQFKPHLDSVQNGHKVVHGQPVWVYKYVVTPQTVLGPMDQPGSYGGEFGDIGLGLTAVVPRGVFAGNRLSVEWLLPVAEDVNGYQLARTGTLSVTWNAAF